MDGLAQRYGVDPFTVIMWSPAQTAFNHRCAVMSDEYRKWNSGN